MRTTMDSKISGGWSMGRMPYSSVARDLIFAMIDARRPVFILPANAERGMRFNDNNTILARLESMFTMDEFTACPGLRIDAALIDAAQSDYWYSHEKQYGTDPEEESEAEGGEDEDGE